MKIVDEAYSISSDSGTVGKYIRAAYQKAGKIPRAVVIKLAAQFPKGVYGYTDRAGLGLDCVVHGDHKLFIIWQPSEKLAVRSIHDFFGDDVNIY